MKDGQKKETLDPSLRRGRPSPDPNALFGCQKKKKERCWTHVENGALVSNVSSMELVRNKVLTNFKD